MNDPRAGTQAQASDLVDVAHLVTAYYTQVPDPDGPRPAGRLRHVRAPRQQPADGLQRDAHPGHDAGHLRLPQGRRATTARCSSAATPTGCPSRPGRRRSRCSSPTTSRCSSTTATATRPPRPSRTRSCAPTAGKAMDGPGLADGIVVTPSHNPPSDGGFKYNPPHGGPADTDATSVIADARQRAHRGRPRRRAPDPVRPGAGGRGVLRLPGHLRRRPARRSSTSTASARPACASAPTRSAAPAVALLGRDRRAARPRPDRGQPPGRPDLAVHDAGLGRQDPDGLLVAVRHGLAHRPQGRLRHRHRQRRRRRPARHRHPGRRADEPQPLPRRGDPVPLRRGPPAVADVGRDRQDAGVLLDDRPGRRVGRPHPHRGAGRVQVVRARPDRRLDRLRRRGVRRGVLPAPRRLGLDHRQGRDHPGPARLGDPRRHREVPQPALRRAHRAVRRPGVRPHRRAGDPRGEGDARRPLPRRRDRPDAWPASRSRPAHRRPRATARRSAASRSPPRARGSRPARPAPRTSTRSTPSPSRARSTSRRSRPRPARWSRPP